MKHRFVQLEATPAPTNHDSGSSSGGHTKTCQEPGTVGMTALKSNEPEHRLTNNAKESFSIRFMEEGLM